MFVGLTVQEVGGYVHFVMRRWLSVAAQNTVGYKIQESAAPAYGEYLLSVGNTKLSLPVRCKNVTCPCLALLYTIVYQLASSYINWLELRMSHVHVSHCFAPSCI